MNAEDSDAEDPDADAGRTLPDTGEAALQRQLEGIAAERGLDRAQVTAAAQLDNMPGVTPTAFTAITGILDVLIDADSRAGTAPGTEEDGT